MEKLNLFAPMSTLGYGVVGLNLLKELNKTHDVSLSLIGGIDTNKEDLEIVQSAMEKMRVFDQLVDAPCLKVWHEFSLAERVGNGPYFAFPFFEINKLDNSRINNLSSVDHIIVASAWAKEIIENTQVNKPVSVVPLGVNRSIFTDNINQVSNKCVFLNCGKWEKRKGHDLLFDMFQSAFPNETDVALHMMPSNPFLPDKVRNEWERYYSSDSRVQIFRHVPSHKEVAQIMRESNCGIFPSRAEGWNLEILEMMSMGKHIITTNYSAHTQYCTSQNSTLIEIESLETAKDGLFFDGSSGEWANLDGRPFEQGVQYMREFYEQWKINPQSINQEGIKTAEKLSWSNTAQQLEEIIYGDSGTETK